MRREFNRQKYKELILLVAKEGERYGGLGQLQFNKTLVDCDLSFYQESGRPMTGQKIQNERNGPISSPLVPLTREMQLEDGSLTEEFVPVGPHKKKVFKATREADESLFTERELELIREKVRFWSELSYNEASTLSHRHFAGWHFSDEGDEIPYASVHLSLEPISLADRAYALELE